ncbi:MAG: aminodeoxychorismate/anthranilate synthase component II, partial [Flavobacteriales bacterium]|nr:aminodeoxychorismate/anthranilate synthase component II [Flavobacteriales bacterium]
RHRTHNICGVQCHPESILTPAGPRMISNWLKR